MSISVRTLSDADLKTADAILSSAFQRSESWIRDLSLFRRLQPDGVFLACQDGIPAGMVATIIYSNFAYVGLMGIHQSFQRHGVGTALMEHVLSWMQEQKVSLVMLDASPAGQPLYEKLGFVPLEEVYVFQRKSGRMNGQHPPASHLLSPQNLDLIIAADTQIFGADRSRLLQTLLEFYPGRAFMLQDEQGQIGGYLFAQEKRIGPWVMNNNKDAEPLLLAALSLPFGGPVSVIVPATNANAITLLQHYGFEITRVNRHMTYGLGAPIGQRQNVFGQASLSLG